MSRVRVATANEEDSVVGPIVLGFAADPLLRFFFPDPHRYLEAFPLMARTIAKAGFERGTVHCTSTFAGAALWLESDVEVDWSPIGPLFERTIEPERRETVMTVLREKDKYVPTEPHWFLHIIGVDPAQQRNGYGAAMLSFALERIDQRHLPAYLESSNPANISLYKRHGFEVITTVEVDGAPPVTPMLRSPR